MTDPSRQEIIKFCLKKKQAAETDEDKAYWQSLLAAQQDIDWDNHPNYKPPAPKMCGDS
jgi:hypothetical protein